MGKDISGCYSSQKATQNGHAKLQIHRVKDSQVTEVLSLSFHRKFRALIITKTWLLFGSKKVIGPKLEIWV